MKIETDMVRFLCLPGYLQNGKIFAEKSSGLRKILTKKNNYQLDYVDPPIIINNKEELPFKLSEDEDEANTKWDAIVKDDINRAWWKHKDPHNYEGFQQSVDFLVNYIKENGPYDGILGFSQGAAMAAIITNTIGEIQPNFKTSIFISGFTFTEAKAADGDKKALDNEEKDISVYSSKVKILPGYEKYFTIPEDFNTTIISVVGANDFAVPAIRGEHLASIYEGKTSSTLFKHDGGHFVPNKKQFLNPIVEKIVSSIDEKANL